MRWGLVGASTIAAEQMIGAFRSLPGSEVTWVVSGQPAHAADFAGRHGIPSSTTSLDEMLADPAVDAVYISSTNEKHRSQALAAIAAGKHVLCEKPLAMTVAEAREMVASAEAAGLVFGTNHHLRNAATHLAMRDLVAGGRIGRVLSARVHHAVFLPPHLQGWRINDAEAGGGVIPDITVHDADTIRFLLGEDPQEVVALSGQSGMGQGVEDSVMSVWSLPSGAMVTAHESFTHHFAETAVEIHGTEGSIYARGVMTQRPVGKVELVTAEGRKPVPVTPHNLYDRAVRLFAEAVQGHGRPSADGWDGVASLAVALAVREAARRGARTQVDYGA
ncbi:Gfo/Idh/MocA family protein [Rubellimicrobium roseum]|uniref:Gfo/Idh/MocA family oxidoreductase n=1 Tax=Rubellimicrobium roseum TaxID=687525 RepID=A0A5C4NJH3_9RHOB|nr:Gfo/Idh/MocA family oxidoreductase [Rubellimicrobium roseum]TNC74733.1 Gfo/Idh/MocA family oxidoreductase [Rubellimicrobium roseum]